MPSIYIRDSGKEGTWNDLSVGDKVCLQIMPVIRANSKSEKWNLFYKIISIAILQKTGTFSEEGAPITPARKKFKKAVFEF